VLAEDPVLDAHRLFAGQAELASAAVKDGADDGAISRFPSLNVRARLFHHAGDVAAGDHRQRQAPPRIYGPAARWTAARPDVDVVEGDRAHPQEDLAAGGSGDGNLLDA
jgi:hypothetical protein